MVVLVLGLGFWGLGLLALLGLGIWGLGLGQY